MVAIAIVAHPDRAEMTEKLAEKVSAQAILWDDLGRGCEANHLAALSWLADGGDEWNVCLEDDARPCEDFVWQLAQVLTVAPTDVVSLYLGTGYPRQWQDTLRTAVVPVGSDPHFLTAPDLLSCVGYAVRARHVRPLIEYVQWARAFHDGRIPIDAAISGYCRTHDLTVSYTRPSLVEHTGTESLITERSDGQDRSQPRRAWRFGTRAHWESTTMAIPEPILVRVDEQGEWYERREKVYEQC